MLLHICTHGPRVPVYSVVTGPALYNLSGNSRCSVPLEAFWIGVPSLYQRVKVMLPHIPFVCWHPLHKCTYFIDSESRAWITWKLTEAKGSSGTGWQASLGF